MLLQIDDLFAGYGELDVLRGVSLNVAAGEIVAVLGANGAGKSTLLRTISRYETRVRSGSIVFDGHDLLRTSVESVVRFGCSHVPEGRQLFGRLSVWDNLMLGAYTLTAEQEIEESLENVLRLFPILKERREQRAETLSGGEQQQLAIARGLMSRPKLLMLDEPSLGIMPKLVAEIFQIIRDIRKQGVTVLLVEQNVFEALEVSDRAYVLQSGRIVLEGRGSDLLSSDLVREAYLGSAGIGS